MWTLRPHQRRTIYDLITPMGSWELSEHRNNGGPYYHLVLLNHSRSCAALYFPTESRVAWSHAHAPSTLRAEALPQDGLPLGLRDCLDILLEGLARGTQAERAYVFTPVGARPARGNPSHGSRARKRSAP